MAFFSPPFFSLPALPFFPAFLPLPWCSPFLGTMSSASSATSVPSSGWLLFPTRLDFQKAEAGVRRNKEEPVTSISFFGPGSRLSPFEEAGQEGIEFDIDAVTPSQTTGEELLWSHYSPHYMRQKQSSLNLPILYTSFLWTCYWGPKNRTFQNKYFEMFGLSLFRLLSKFKFPFPCLSWNILAWGYPLSPVRRT